MHILLSSGGRGTNGAGRLAVVAAAVAVIVIGVVAAPVSAAIQPPPLEEFVPIDELPEDDRLPAAPFLIAAYSLVWIFAFGYFWMLSRRLSGVERELADLTRRAGTPEDGEPRERS